VEIDVRIAGRRATVALTGPLTGAENVRTLRDTIDILLQGGYEEIVINLDGVTDMDSTGLGEVVRIHATVAQRRAHLKLVNPTQRILHLLTITKLTTVFEVFDPRSHDARWRAAVWATFWVLLILILVIVWRFSGAFGDP
jgi:anti-sigma B factor antagonist